ncbi:MAG: pyridoxamine 5'-phosphate oxidase family protein [Halioglobus sp.]|nr:pyridoxamine 5'-phosphate oxidase family protein [Halioglobus sp.]
MAEQFDRLEDGHIAFIAAQHIFFVGTAGAQGHVNVSPKGMDSFRVLDPGTVAWLNLTGSGNETAAHVRENGRMTVMFCAFDRQPLILRLYGQAAAVHPGDARWEELAELFPAHPGARQVFVLEVSLVQTSCGYGVPADYEFAGERPTATNGRTGAARTGSGSTGWRNARSLDGADTGIPRDG